MWGHRPQMHSGARSYWGQWESHYGPMQRRPASRRHQTTAMFAPTIGYRPLARPDFPAMPNVPTPPKVISEKPVQEASLYYDFNAPPKPNVLSVRCAVQSIQADLQWTAPRVNKGLNFTYKIKITGDSKGETVLEYASWKTSATISLEPGNWYKIVVEAVSSEKILSAGEVSFKSILCSAEMALLQMKAINFLQASHGTHQMQEVMIFYRNKPPDYWHKITSFDGVMRPYLKDQCGNPGSPINGEINGLFFAARLHNGMLPVSSPFGGQRLKLLCPKLFLPETHNMYFGDFYCNTYVHYVTVVICIKNSPVDAFCREQLDSLDPFDNMFMHLTVDDYGNYRYFINNNVWVEVYYTGDVPVWWGEFDYTISMGQSKPNGIPNNKFCTMCNLYPLEPPPQLEQSPPTTLLSTNQKRPHDQDVLDDESGVEADEAKKPRHDWTLLRLPRCPLADHPWSTFHVLIEAARRATSSLLPADAQVVQREETLAVVVETLCHVVDSVVSDGGATSDDSNEDAATNTLVMNVPPFDHSKRLSDVEERKFVDKILAEYGDWKDEGLNVHLVPLEPDLGLGRCRVTVDGLRVGGIEIEAKTKKLNENLIQLKLFMKSLEKKLAALV